MLADSLTSEAYRFLRNRPAVMWSTLFVPIVGLVITILSQMFLKQKMAEIKNARLPADLLQSGPLNLGEQLISLAAGLANPMTILFVMIGAAVIYAGDYRWETWRLISARNTRPNLILGKVGVVKLLALAALLIMLVAGFFGEMAKGFIFERSMSFSLDGEGFGHVLGLSLVSYVRVVQVTLLGLLAAVVTRSLLATLFVPLVVTVGQFFLMQTMPLLGWEPTDWIAQLLIPGLATDTLHAAIQGGVSAPPAGAVWPAVISLALWCLAPLAGAIAVFGRQDLSKE
jgi:ABC-2 type transport system permease protein